MRTLSQLTRKKEIWEEFLVQNKWTLCQVWKLGNKFSHKQPKDDYWQTVNNSTFSVSFKYFAWEKRVLKCFLSSKLFQAINGGLVNNLRTISCLFFSQRENEAISNHCDGKRGRGGGEVWNSLVLGVSLTGFDDEKRCCCKYLQSVKRRENWACWISVSSQTAFCLTSSFLFLFFFQLILTKTTPARWSVCRIPPLTPSPITHTNQHALTHHPGPPPALSLQVSDQPCDGWWDFL